MVIHKQGKQYAERYAGFGRYEKVPSPLCVGAKMVWRGYSYYVHRNWSKVTCKHCLKTRSPKE
jgi:hypothetical protein